MMNQERWFVFYKVGKTDEIFETKYDKMQGQPFVPFSNSVFDGKLKAIAFQANNQATGCLQQATSGVYIVETTLLTAI